MYDAKAALRWYPRIKPSSALWYVKKKQFIFPFNLMMMVSLSLCLSFSLFLSLCFRKERERESWPNVKDLQKMYICLCNVPSRYKIDVDDKKKKNIVREYIHVLGK